MSECFFNDSYKSEKNRLGHPTQKPLKLFQRIIKASSDKGDLVLDCFMGSGVVGEASVSMGRNFIGIELDTKYFDIAHGRISAA